MVLKNSHTSDMSTTIEAWQATKNMHHKSHKDNIRQPYHIKKRKKLKITENSTADCTHTHIHTKGRKNMYNQDTTVNLQYYKTLFLKYQYK